MKCSYYMYVVLKSAGDKLQLYCPLHALSACPTIPEVSCPMTTSKLSVQLLASEPLAKVK